MTPATEEVPTELMDAALQLPWAARRHLADRLLASLDGPGPLSPEWKAEIARRLQAQDEGRMPTYTLAETMAYLRAVDAEGRQP
jgi:putative addiction module component (TIGR02574 family)